MSASQVLACPTCGRVHADAPLPPGTVARCTQCNTTIARCPRDGLQRTIALSLSAVILYLPANVFPILYLQQNGARSSTTVFGSARLLFNDGDYFVALIVFAASVAIPLLKLLGLFYLSAAAWLGARHGRRFRTVLYRTIDSVGRWAMLDVFAMAVLVAVVKLNGLATITPGSGVLPFVCVVILTLLASASFEPRMIWNTRSENRT